MKQRNKLDDSNVVRTTKQGDPLRLGYPDTQQGAQAITSYGAYPFEPNSQKEGNLLEYWRILLRHKWTWILTTVFFGLAGVLVSLPQTPLYRAQTSLEILSLNEDFMGMSKANQYSNNVDSSDDTSDLQTQIKILQSNSVLGRVLTKFGADLPELHRKKEAHVPDWWRRMGLPTPPETNERLEELQNVAKSLKVKAAPRTRIVELTVDARTPQLAKDFANTIANEFIEQNLESRWQTTQKTSDWLSHQLDDTRRKLEHSEDALNAYARRSGLLFTDEKTNVAEEKLKQLQQELSVATADRISKQSSFELTKSSPADSLPEILNDVSLRQSQAKLTDLSRQLADLRSMYTTDYPRVTRLQAQIESVQAAYNHDKEDLLNRITNEYKAALRRERLLADAYNQQAIEVTGEGEKSIQYGILKREADSNRQLYDTMLQQLKESTIASAMRASNIRVVDAADLPERPHSPNYPVNISLGLFAGLLLGVVFVLIRERIDQTLQRPGEAQFWTNAPELGTIPDAKIERGKVAYSSSPSTKVLGVSPGNGSGSRLEVMTWGDHSTQVAEAFRATLSSILFIDHECAPQLIVVSSGSAAEGKSTIVSNLGIAIAEIRKSVLIIDADLRRPRINQHFNLANDRGLSTCLAGQASIEESLDLAVQETHVPGLSIITSGPATNNATHLLHSSRLLTLLTECKKRYEMIIVDTPPILQITDGRILGRLADAVVVVARANLTTRDALIAVHEKLNQDGSRVMGTILNGWDPRLSHGGYYGYYAGSSYKAYHIASR